MARTIFEFIIIATGLDPQAENFEPRFWEAGCDDATISFQNGRIIADFARESPTIEEALASAVANVRQAGATVERIEPDPLVSLSDMATRSGMSRAAMTNYFKGHRQDGFPPPCAKVTSNSPLWDWADAAEWLADHGRLDAKAAHTAAVLRAANEAIARGAKDFSRALQMGVKKRAKIMAAA